MPGLLRRELFLRVHVRRCDRDRCAMLVRTQDGHRVVRVAGLPSAHDAVGDAMADGPSRRRRHAAGRTGADLTLSGPGSVAPADPRYASAPNGRPRAALPEDPAAHPPCGRASRSGQFSRRVCQEVWIPSRWPQPCASTTRSLADKIGVSVAFLSNLEHGPRQTYEALAHALGVAEGGCPRPTSWRTRSVRAYRRR